MKNNQYSFLIVVLLIIVVLLFVGFNIKFNKDNGINQNLDFYKKNIDNLNYKIDEITIEGIKEKIKVVRYNSHLGFSISYDIEKFKPSLLSNGIVEFIYYDNTSVKLRVEKLTENDYYEKYQTSNIEEIIDNKKYSYKYMRKNNSYYRLVTIIPDDIEYSDIRIRIDYMTSSFDINQ